MNRSGVETQLYQVVRIDADVLTFETYTATGILFDKFELKKQEDGK
jgi:acid phosphatase type 7